MKIFGLLLTVSFALLAFAATTAPAAAAAMTMSDEDILDLHRGMLSDDELKDMERELQGYGRGRGGGGGMGGGGGHGGGGMTSAEHSNIQYLFANHKTIKRRVRRIRKGARAVTTSTNSKVASALQTHVEQMINLVGAGRRVRWWDPLFDGIFDNYKAMGLRKKNLKNGVMTWITGSNKCTVALARGHAATVSKFAKNGQPEAQRKHKKPRVC